MLVLVVFAVALAGCGGGGDAPDPRAEIAETLRAGLTTNDPELLCMRTLSPALARRIYGSTKKCLAVEAAANASGRTVRSARVSRVKVDGDRASAYIVLTGGNPPGASPVVGPGAARGGLEVVRGKAGWRLDDMSHEFLRSVLKAGLVGNPEVGQALGECLAGKVDGLDDSSLRRMAFGAMGGVPGALEQMQQLVAACVQGTGSQGPGAIS